MLSPLSVLILDFSSAQFDSYFNHPEACMQSMIGLFFVLRFSLTAERFSTTSDHPSQNFAQTYAEERRFNILLNMKRHLPNPTTHQTKRLTLPHNVVLTNPAYISPLPFSHPLPKKRCHATKIFQRGS